MAATPPPDSGSGTETPPVRDPEFPALLQCLLHGDRNPVTVYNAIQEIKAMSGEVVVAKLSALIETRTAETTVRLADATSRLTELIEARAAETNGKLAETNQSLAETNGRLDAVESQLRAVWGLLVPTLVAVIGVLLSAVLG